MKTAHRTHQRAKYSLMYAAQMLCSMLLFCTGCTSLSSFQVVRTDMPEDSDRYILQLFNEIGNSDISFNEMLNVVDDSNVYQRKAVHLGYHANLHYARGISQHDLVEPGIREMAFVTKVGTSGPAIHNTVWYYRVLLKGDRVICLAHDNAPQSYFLDHFVKWEKLPGKL